jgi:sugar phosphate isomerase/epimerase
MALSLKEPPLDTLGEKNQHAEPDRRTFLKELARYGGGALAIGSYASRLRAEGTVDWSQRIGIQLVMVRDEMAKDVESTLAQLAAIGYRFVNPVGFSGLDAKAYRAMLDRHGLSAPQIDLGFSMGAGMEEDLEACQILGIKYAEPALGGSAQRGSARSGGATDPYARPAGFRRLATPLPQTEEEAKHAASDYNTYGKTARKFGIKVIFHNHVEHFELLTGSKSTFFDVFLSETDPELVGMELDLGFTAIAGRNIPEAIRKYPGRFPVWDVRDALGLKNADANPALTPNQRRQYTYSVPVGLGEVDFKTIFASAETAGLKNFFVLQDNAAAWGDSMAVARVSWQNLTKILTPSG